MNMNKNLPDNYVTMGTSEKLDYISNQLLPGITIPLPEGVTEAGVNRAAQAFYEASHIPMYMTDKPKVVDGLRGALFTLDNYSATERAQGLEPQPEIYSEEAIATALLAFHVASKLHIEQKDMEKIAVGLRAAIQSLSENP